MSIPGPLCTRSDSVCSSSKLLTSCPPDYISEAVTYACLCQVIDGMCQISDTASQRFT